ncbi:MAG: zinc ABC transporter substrate-binding protein [Pseudomonadota bacterium]|nr:zinc ABC transporter substrate-binding protein [Pseudomonadota bacterium]
MKTFALALGLVLGASAATADPIRVVAAENVYADLARQIGGAYVEASGILTNPDQDPHLFEASPRAARDVAAAQVVIVNGADYDPWMAKLIAASPTSGRREIDVGALVGVKPGANPHLWYGPDNIKAAARAMAEAFAALDPPHATQIDANAAAFLASMREVDDLIAAMRSRYQGVAVAASEPVFGYATQAIGLDVREQKFALAVMNDAEPSPSDVAAFENDLKGRKVRAMIYNAQASAPAVERLVRLAKASGVPVVGVSETEPPNTRYQDWVRSELDALDHALGAPLN